MIRDIFVSMEQHVFTISLIIEGATEKVLQFMLPLKSIYKKSFGLTLKNVFLNTAERLEKKILFIIALNLS